MKSLSPEKKHFFLIRCAVFIVFLSFLLSSCSQTPSQNTAPTSQATETQEAASSENTKETPSLPKISGLQFEKIGNINGDQDGAIWNGFLFRFNAKGQCFVYHLQDLIEAPNTDAKDQRYATFYLDRYEEFVPHSNSVVFGPDKYDPDDEFPLLYCNVYNNYSGKADKQKGVLCVYRLMRKGNSFSTQLVQLIQVGFCESETLWASPGKNDARPYGNFVIDGEKRILYAFTMRDSLQQTRYFSFSLPDWRAGEPDSKLGVNKVVLQTNDVITAFDTPYHYRIQGACFHKGMIYSLEGYTNSTANPAAIRIISPNDKKQEYFFRLADYNQDVEPEVIDFWEGNFYYADVKGNLFILHFTTE